MQPNDYLAACASLELERLDREERWRTDPFSWYRDCATLIDPLAATDNKIAPFPDYPYLAALVNELDNHNAIILWKSRRMIASWTAIAYAVRLCMLFKHMRCYMISRKEGETDGEGSRELVWRARFIAENIRNAPHPKIEAGKLHIAFTDTGSSITGISCEPNAMRQVSANLVIADEFAFWDRPREAYAALKPTLESRGKFIGISSSAEGFFKEIVRDEVEEGGGPARGGVVCVPGQGVLLSSLHTVVSEDAVAPAERNIITSPTIPGFAAWTNPVNKFRIVAVHYTADPRKRSAEWKRREQEGVPLSIWLREYEMQFSVSSGMPVYLHEWRPARMVVERLKTERHRPILVSVDFGYHHPAMLVGQMRYALQLCVLRCLQGKQLRFEDFMQQCIAQLKEWFPQRDPQNTDEMLWCCDAAGTQENGVGAPEVQIMRRAFNLRPKFKKVLIPPTIDIVRGYMSRDYRGEPCFLVDNNPTTSILIDGLNGGYAYPEGEVNETTRPEKDNTFDHMQDCFSADTDILTTNGWEPFPQLTRGIEVATVNLDTDQLEYQVPSHYIARPHTGDMIHLHGRKMDALVTPNHRMVVYPRDEKVYPDFVPAESLSIWDKIKLTANWAGVTQDKLFTIAKSGMSPEVQVDKRDFAEMLGWYIAEGSAASTIKMPGAGYGVVISQNTGLKKEILRSVLARLPWRWNENKDGFYTSSKQLWEIVKPLGNTYTKSIPEWVRFAAPEVINRFLGGAILGDGWIIDGKATYATVSKVLADQVQELFIKTGRGASLRTIKAKPYCIKGRSGTNTVDQYWVAEYGVPTAALRDGQNTPNFGAIKYSGMVYCVSVPNQTLVVRRNGRPFIAGNCLRYLAVNFGGNHARASRAQFDQIASADILKRPTYTIR